MTAATMAGAENEIEALFRAAWILAGYPAANIEYKNKAFGKPATGGTIWSRFEIGYAGGPTRTLGGVTGKARRARVGSVLVTLHSPLGSATALARGLVEMTIRAYEGKRTASGAVFRDPHEVSSGSDGVWWQSIVSVDFEYHQLT
ncbi:MAG: hypothetical protein H0U23_07620 [Blastocatellia bacterium]|nr:hypothetical protein [Blastocatellia bacterium]